MGLAILLACAFVGIASAREIPSYIHVCKRSDPEVAKCINASVEVLRPRLRKGIPELEVPAIEPLHIPEIVIARGDDGSNYRAVLKDIDVYGTSDFQITKLKLDIPNSLYRIGVILPVLRLMGTYDLDARILVPVRGHGKFEANATNCVGHGVLRATITNEDGERRMKFTDLNMKLRIGDYNIRLDNLFGGDPILSRAVHDILHENKNEFTEAATPFIQRKVSEIILTIANKIVKHFNYDEVFPEK